MVDEAAKVLPTTVSEFKITIQLVRDASEMAVVSLSILDDAKLEAMIDE